MKSKIAKLLKVVGLGALLLAAGVGVYMLVSPKPPRPPDTVSDIAEIEAYLDELTAFGTPPGLSLAVVKEGQLVYSKGFGWADGPNRVPATPETVYKWWSMTKIPTAMAIIQLEEQGLLNLDDAVRDHLPFFEIVYPAGTSAPVTIRHLLNHSSGLPNNSVAVIGWMHLEDEPRPDQTEFLQAVLPDYTKLKFEPGDHAAYTNVGYMVLGAIIEEASGQTYEAYVSENILQPLGMSHTDFVYNEAMRAHAAIGSHPVVDLQSAFLPFLYGKKLGDLVRETSGGKMWFNHFYPDSDPPTGLIGPATDLARLMLAYLNGGQLEGTRILSAEQVDKMSYQDHIRIVSMFQDDTLMQGLGWEIHPDDDGFYLTHGGDGPGFGSELRLYPDRALGIVIIANDMTYDRGPILDLIASLPW